MDFIIAFNYPDLLTLTHTLTSGVPLGCRRMANKQEIPDLLKEEWKQRAPPLTGPAFRRLNVDFSPLYESLSEHLEVPKQKGGDGKGTEDGI